MLMRTLLSATLALALTTGAAFADDDADRAREALKAGRILPLAKIMAEIQRQVPGEILETKLDIDDDDDDIPEYEIRVLTPNGRIVELDVDARDGRILDMDEDD
jgi:uncharacterized membrane protein YkoI